MRYLFQKLFGLILAIEWLCLICTPALGQDKNSSVQELLSSNRKDTAIVWALKSKSFKYSFINIDTSKLLAQKAIDISRKIKYPVGEGLALSNMGIAYNVQGDGYNALRYFIRARDIYDSLNDERRVAQAMSYCAMVYGGLEEYEKALETRSQIVPIQKRLNDTRGLAYSFVNMGFLFTNVNLLDSAQIYYDNCLTLFDSLGDEYGMALAYHGLGRINKKLGNDKKLIEYINQAVKLFKKHQINEQLAEAYRDLGDYYLGINSMKRAYNYYKSGIDLAKKINTEALLMELYKDLYKWHKLMGQPNLALEFYEMHIALKDSLFSDTQMKDLEILKARENEIAILNENNLLKQKELTIQTRFRNLLLVGIISILVLSVFLYRNYQINVRHNNELQASHLEIAALTCSKL